MHHARNCICALCLLGRAAGQTPHHTERQSAASVNVAAPVPVEPMILSRAALDDRVVTLHLAPRIATSIRLPEPVNSVVLGDPDHFTAEHSEHEPDLVTIKPVTESAFRTNLLITTASGRQVNLLLITGDDPTRGTVDVLLKYGKPSAESFLVDETPTLSSIVAETRKIDTENPGNADAMAPSTEITREGGVGRAAGAADSPSSGLDELLARQQKAPLPTLYGQLQTAIGAGPRVRAGVSEVLDKGTQVAVLFSVLNPATHAIEILPPQVQLGGKVKKKWTTAQQLRVLDFRLTTRRLGAGQRADGVVLFERPAFKQSTETLFLQIADSGAVDKPALAPVGFGISSIQGGSAYANR
jgi:hypothetical protein